jgi:hypothetical protein
MGGEQPGDREQEIKRECPRHRLEFGRLAGLGRHRPQRREHQAEDKLNPADQDFAVALLATDDIPDSLGRLVFGTLAENGCDERFEPRRHDHPRRYGRT